MSKPLYVMDIDGCLADASRRFAEAGPEPDRGDKAEYTSWVMRVQNSVSLLADRPNPGMRDLVSTLSKESHVVYLTAREEKWREITTLWLLEHGFPMVPLHMRQENDWDSSGEYKSKLLDRWSHGYSTIVVVDDDPKGDIEAACAERGITFLKCRTGSY